jgi:uncharacterized membrane protein YphA (DoxX/SURF4 family)
MPKAPFEGVESRHEFRTITVGPTLQRLFSTFPDGWPGFGLLLMRLGMGISLIYLGTAGLWKEIQDTTSVAQNLIATAAGVSLLAGLWTPIMGALAALGQMWIALSLPSSQPAGEWIHILLAVLSASAAMLGPGAWSIDARLFGRRRFYHDRNRGRSNPPKG